ncbi:hypothetical protein [Leifsonia sp. SIMBA_070]|uniref:hypothetical protein n=1 Tax=Leifsonia sp. SIMBA_070 TaxID=3085810 RepID=UPI00397DE769
MLNTGHRHPKVVEAAKAQEDRFTHTSFQVILGLRAGLILGILCGRLGDGLRCLVAAGSRLILSLVLSPGRESQNQRQQQNRQLD